MCLYLFVCLFTHSPEFVLQRTLVCTNTLFTLFSRLSLTQTRTQYYFIYFKQRNIYLLIFLSIHWIAFSSDFKFTKCMLAYRKSLTYVIYLYNKTRHSYIAYSRPNGLTDWAEFFLWTLRRGQYLSTIDTRTRSIYCWYEDKIYLLLIRGQDLSTVDTRTRSIYCWDEDKIYLLWIRGQALSTVETRTKSIYCWDEDKIYITLRRGLDLSTIDTRTRSI